MEDKLLPESLLKIVIPQGKCKVCRIKNAKVLYFDIPVCSGCRAFFIRSMKSNKSYYCLNGRLCGRGNELVPTRRICKKCRFDRCVKAGMLEAKIRLQNYLENLKKAREEMMGINQLSKQISLTAQVEDPKNVLGLFVRFRQKYRHGLQQLFGPIEPRESLGGAEDMETVSQNLKVYNQTIASTSAEKFNLFGRIDPNDLQTLCVFEYSNWAMAIEGMLLTIHNFGNKSRKTYGVDYTYGVLNMDYIHKQWRYLLPAIQVSTGRHGQKVFEILMDYMFEIDSKIGVKLADLVEKGQYDEHEISALLLLLMTREACVLIAKNPETQEYLKWLRNQTFQSLAKHIESTGRNVNERMSEIVFLISEFLELGHVMRKFMHLIMVATQYCASPEESVANYDLFVRTNSEFIYF